MCHGREGASLWLHRRIRHGLASAPPLTLAFLLVATTLVAVSGPGAAAPAAQHATAFADGSATMESDLTDPARGATVDLGIDPTWQVQRVTLGLRGLPLTVDAGTGMERPSWPRDLVLRVGGPTGEIAWEDADTVGHQHLFIDGDETLPLTFRPGETQVATIRLPPAHVSDASLTVTNGRPGQYRYSLMVGDQPTPVWKRGDDLFEPRTFIPTTANITALAAASLDPERRLAPDIVGAGSGGTVIVVPNRGDVADRFGDPESISLGPRGDALAIGTGDYDQDLRLDLVTGASDGTASVLQGLGGGVFGSPVRVPISSLPVTAVALADIDNDGDGDLVAGLASGEICVATDDLPHLAWNPAVCLEGGTSAITAVAVGDLDADGTADVGAASLDNKFHWIRSGGPSPGFVTMAPIPAGTGGILGLAVTDLDADGDPDLAGAAGDGHLYVASNLGHGTFDRPIVIPVAEKTLRAMAAVDVDLDSDADLLTVSSDGGLYLAENAGNEVIAEGRKVQDLGPAATSIAAGDVDLDLDPDLIVGSTGSHAGIQVLENVLGPFEETLGESFRAALDSEVQLRAADPDQVTVRNGIPTVDVPIEVTYAVGERGALSMSDLSVTSDWTATVDLTGPVTRYLAAHRAGGGGAGTPIRVPLELRTAAPGRVWLGDLDIAYLPTFTARVGGAGLQTDGSIPDVLTSASLHLTCRASGDAAGTSGEVAYAWTTGEGRTIGSRPDLDIGSADSLVPPLPPGISHAGRRPITCTATARTGIFAGSVATATAVLNLVEPPHAKLRVDYAPQDSHVVEGDTVVMDIKVWNTGETNASYLRVVVVDTATGQEIQEVRFSDIEPGEKPVVQQVTMQPGVGNHTYTVVVLDSDHAETRLERSTTGLDVIPAPFNLGFWGTVGILSGFIIAVGGVAAGNQRHHWEIRARKRREAELAAMAGAAQATLDRLNAMVAGSVAGRTQPGGIPAGASWTQAPNTGIMDGFRCPRCGRPSEEHGRQCTGCDVRDEIAKARLAIDGVRSLGLDVENEEELIEGALDAAGEERFDAAIALAATAQECALELQSRFDQALQVRDGIAEDERVRRQRRLNRIRDERQDRLA